LGVCCGVSAGRIADVRAVCFCDGGKVPPPIEASATATP
jgi:hypothetical protein